MFLQLIYSKIVHKWWHKNRFGEIRFRSWTCPFSRYICIFDSLSDIQTDHAVSMAWPHLDSYLKQTTWLLSIWVDLDLCI